MKRRLSLFLLGAGFITGLAACSSFNPPPKPQYFTLDPGRAPAMESLGAASANATASVSFVDVAAPFASDGFVYQTSAHRWEVDPYNQFLVSPADMMTSVLRNWLRQSGLYGEVAETGVGGGQDFLVDCNLTELYGDFQNPNAPVAILKLEAQVFRRTDKGRVVVLRKTFSQAVPFGQRTPAALVEAWNEGLRVELNELLRALGELRR